MPLLIKAFQTNFLSMVPKAFSKSRDDDYDDPEDVKVVDTEGRK